MAAAIPFIGLGLAAMGTMSQQQGQQQAAAANAAGNIYNAKVEGANAQIALDQGDAQAQIDAQNTERALGAARAAYGSSGVDVNSGSPLSVMSDLATEGELTRQLTQYRSRLEATGDEMRAGYDILAAQSGLQAGQTTSQTTILTGAGRLLGSANFGGVSTPAPSGTFSPGQIPADYPAPPSY